MDSSRVSTTTPSFPSPSTSWTWSALQKLRQRFQEIRDIDYFESSRGEDLQRLFQKAEALETPRKKPELKARLRVEDFRNKTWITRPRPEIDRVGSAWLIGKFIDAGAKFGFANKPQDHPDAIPYSSDDRRTSPWARAAPQRAFHRVSRSRSSQACRSRLWNQNTTLPGAA